MGTVIANNYRSSDSAPECNGLEPTRRHCVECRYRSDIRVEWFGAEGSSNHWGYVCYALGGETAAARKNVDGLCVDFERRWLGRLFYRMFG